MDERFCGASKLRLVRILFWAGRLGWGSVKSQDERSPVSSFLSIAEKSTEPTAFRVKLPSIYHLLLWCRSCLQSPAVERVLFIFGSILLTGGDPLKKSGSS